MKTAVSIPDNLFHRAEELARVARKSRSQVYAEALREYLARHDPELVRSTLDRVAAEFARDDDTFAAAAAQRVMERSEW
jgi:metal-responsive CopG/Arc/MetJ family transcriptional regulator